MILLLVLLEAGQRGLPEEPEQLWIEGFHVTVIEVAFCYVFLSCYSSYAFLSLDSRRHQSLEAFVPFLGMFCCLFLSGGRSCCVALLPSPCLDHKSHSLLACCRHSYVYSHTLYLPSLHWLDLYRPTIYSHNWHHQLHRCLVPG